MNLKLRFSFLTLYTTGNEEEAQLVLEELRKNPQYIAPVLSRGGEWNNILYLIMSIDDDLFSIFQSLLDMMIEHKIHCTKEMLILNNCTNYSVLDMAMGAWHSKDKGTRYVEALLKFLDQQLKLDFTSGLDLIHAVFKTYKKDGTSDKSIMDEVSKIYSKEWLPIFLEYAIFTT